MKKYIAYTLSILLLTSACEQETIDLQTPETDLTNTGNEPNCEGASAGSANFSKYIAIGNSLTAGFQAGALFTEGQNTSLGNLLARQFSCVGGGNFNQPDINSENGFLFTGTTNPLPNGTVLGRLRLQGTPAAPAPTVSNAQAIPNALANPSFLYSGDKSQLNNFGVPGIQIGQILIPETGDWTKADLDPATPGAQPHPAFNPFYARFASAPGTSTILSDAMGALANGGTFFSFWLGNNDVLGYAVGGGSNPAIFTSTEAFQQRFTLAINALLSVPNVKGVVGNIPEITVIPYFTTVRYNAVPLDATTAGALNAGFGGYNQVLEGIKANGPLMAAFGLTAAELDSRKVVYAASTTNQILIIDETLTDLGGAFDALLGAGAITAEQRAGLVPYENVRQATSTDLITLAAGAILGRPVGGNPQLVNGLTVPLTDQYVLIPSEIMEIKERTTAFNTIIAEKVSASGDRLALADIYSKFNQLAFAGGQFINGVLITPTLAPPTGGFSEDGVHPNSRGVAFMANVFIEAINSKFGAQVPAVNLSKYGATGLPINP